MKDHVEDLGYALLLRKYVEDPALATPAQIDQAAWDTVPSVGPMFWSFRLMVGLGLFLIAFFAMLLTHGAVYLAVKTEGEVAQRARTISRFAALTWVLLFALAGLWLWMSHFGFAITSGAMPGGQPDPLAKTATPLAGAWLVNYGRWPVTMLIPAVGLAAPLAVAALAGIRRRLIVFVVSALGIAGVIGTMGVSLFPFLLPSSSHPGSSLTVWDASSSHRKC